MKKSLILTIPILLIITNTLISQPNYDINQWIKMESEGMYSAYVRALAVDPQNSDIIYIGLKGGGVYKSENGAISWDEKNTGLTNIDILSLAVNPKHTNIIYVGTEQGIFRSDQSGDNWKQLNFPSCHVNSIAVHPIKDTIVYAATGKLYGKWETSYGLWISNDSGENWHQCNLRVSKIPTDIPIDVYTVAAFPNSDTDETEIRVCVGSNNGIWIDTTDTGAFRPETNDNNLWTGRIYCFASHLQLSTYMYAGTIRGLRLRTKNVTTDTTAWLKDEITLTGEWITSLAVDDSFIYAGTYEHGIFKSKIFTRVADAHWEKIAPDNIRIVHGIFVDSNDQSKQYFVSPKGFYKKDTDAKFYPQITGISCAQMNEFVFNPENPNLLFAATQSGGFKSRDGGKSWAKIDSILSNTSPLPDKEIIVFANDPQIPSKVYAIVQADGIYESNDEGINWSKITPSTQNIFSILIYYEMNLRSIIYGSDKGIFKNNRLVCDKTLFPVSIIIEDTLRDILYAGTKGNGIFKCNRLKETWEKIEDNDIAFSIVNTLAIDSTCTSLYCGTERGIYKTYGDDSEWMQIDDPAIKYFKVNDLCFHPENSKILLAGTEQGGVFISRDLGETWVDFNQSLDNYNILCLNTLSDDPVKFYAGTEGSSIYFLNFCDPKIIVSPPDTILFEDTMVECSLEKWITIENKGKADLFLYNIISSNEAFEIDFEKATIISNDSIKVKITFKPECAILYLDSLKIISNDPFSPVYTLYLKGNGVASIILLATEHDFENVRVGSPKNWTLKIINAGNEHLLIDSIKVLNYPEIFAIDATSGNIAPEPSDTFAVTITFTPLDTIEYPDQLIIYSNAYKGENIVHLNGIGIAPILYYEGTDCIDFESVKLKHSRDAVLTIRNTGSDILSITNIFLKNEFDSIFTACPRSSALLPDSSLAIKVAFSPLQRLNYIDTLFILSDTYEESDRLKMIELKGLGVAPKIYIAESDLSYDFGEANLNEKPKEWELKIKNIGNDLLIIDKLCLCDSNIFKTKEFNKEIAPDESTIITLMFKPQQSISYDGYLIIFCNDPETSKLEIKLQGIGIGVADCNAPNITHTQEIFYSPKGEAILINAIISDDFSGIAWKRLYIRMGGSTSFFPLEFNDTQAIIPQEFVTNRGIEYYIAATDNAGNFHQVPDSLTWFSISVTSSNEFATDSIGNPLKFSGGDQQSNYRMFSIPFILENSDPKSILVDDLGDNCGGQNWRLVEYIGNGNIIDYPNTSEFRPGKGFWLIIREPEKIIDTGPARTVFTSDISRKMVDEEIDYAKIQLKNDWNIIGNPFNFPISTSNLRFASGETLLNFLQYEGSWNGVTEEMLVEPWKGYAIKPNSETDLIIDPCRINNSPISLVKANNSSIFENCWQVQISVRFGNVLDTYNYFGVHPNASLEWDIFDRYEPPFIGDYATVLFRHEDWSVNPDVYTYDFQPPSEEGNCWEVESKTNMKNFRIDLIFSGLITLPASFKAILVDKSLKIFHDLQKDSVFSYYSFGDRATKKMRLVVGNENFINENNLEIDEMNIAPCLLQNFPNPFNQTTIISYRISRKQKVTLVIYNLLGKQEKTLINNEEKDVGYHQVLWDGKNDENIQVASGIYFITIKLGVFTNQRKLIFIK